MASKVKDAVVWYQKKVRSFVFSDMHSNLKTRSPFIYLFFVGICNNAAETARQIIRFKAGGRENVFLKSGLLQKCAEHLIFFSKLWYLIAEQC